LKSFRDSQSILSGTETHKEFRGNSALKKATNIKEAIALRKGGIEVKKSLGKKNIKIKLLVRKIEIS